MARERLSGDWRKPEAHVTPGMMDFSLFLLMLFSRNITVLVSSVVQMVYKQQFCSFSFRWCQARIQQQ